VDSRTRLRRGAPVLLVMVVSGLLAEAGPSLAVWVAALIWPLLAVASLLVARWWSALPPRLAVLFPCISMLPAVHHCWVFNLEGNVVLAWALPFALPLALMMVVVARRARVAQQVRDRRGFLVAIAAVSAMGYGLGAAYFVNTFFDRGPVRTSQATVQSLWVKSTYFVLFKEYDVNVNPWGSRRTVTSINVSADVMAALDQGDTVSIEQLPGALGIPWVRIALPVPTRP